MPFFACSVLKKAYRDRLCISEDVRFVFLRANRGRVADQLHWRRDHFLPAALLDSQFADLEEPQPEEHALIVDLAGLPGEVASLIKTKLSLQS